MSRAGAPEPITMERLERARAFVAKLIVRDGAVYAPYFRRLEREIEALRANDDILSRARRLVSQQEDAHAARG